MIHQLLFPIWTLIRSQAATLDDFFNIIPYILDYSGTCPSAQTIRFSTFIVISDNRLSSPNHLSPIVHSYLDLHSSWSGSGLPQRNEVQGRKPA